MKKTMYLFLVFFAYNFSMAQDNQVRVKVFDGNDVQQETTPSKKLELHDQNLITLNPYLLLRGAFVVGYERVLHPKHALGAYLGFTYQDFIYQVFNDISDSDGPVSDDDTKPGYYMDLSYKWYPKGYGNFEGLYLSPGFVRRTYHLSNMTSVTNYNTDTDVKVNLGYSMTEGYLKFGYTYESWWFDDLISDVYFGIGYRTITSQNYDIVKNGAMESVVQYEKVKGVPAMYLGFRFGIPF